ncbi:MAG: twin-arginine translocation signal domain-containing protein, partial [Bacteroidota bacterium]
MSNKILSKRRDFLKLSGVVGLGLTLGLDSKAVAHNISRAKAVVLNLEINPFIIISTDGSIALINPRPDMGQGST